MALTEVKITEEVWLTCLTHALSTETEEIMGLLLGDIEYVQNGSVVAVVWGAAPQTRSDRRKDRVETNPEQLAAAAALAEKMTTETGKTTRVIGWYHSHPHITVMPSHVDVKTQAMYQMLDPGFVGLIFSCFSEDANKVGRIQVIAFQSLEGPGKHRPVPIVGTGAEFSDVNSATQNTANSGTLDLGIHAPSKFSSGRAGSKQQASALENLFAMADKERRSSGGSFAESSPEDESLSMQEAMHLSNLEASGAEFIRKEVPLKVIPGCSLAHLKFPLASLVDLQRILFQEEQAAYRQAIEQSTVGGQIHPLAAIHHSATYQATLSKLMEYCLLPAISALTDILEQNKLQLKRMQEEEEAVQLERLFITSKSSISPTPTSVRRITSQRGMGLSISQQRGSLGQSSVTQGGMGQSLSPQRGGLRLFPSLHGGGGMGWSSSQQRGLMGQTSPSLQTRGLGQMSPPQRAGSSHQNEGGMPSPQRGGMGQSSSATGLFSQVEGRPATEVFTPSMKRNPNGRSSSSSGRDIQEQDTETDLIRF